MIIIRCAKCKRKLLKYRKVGAGRVLKCHKKRISRFYQKPTQIGIVCECGELIGNNEEKYYRMKQGSFIYTGKVIK